MNISKCLVAVMLMTGAAVSVPCATAVEIKYELNPTATMRDILQENVKKRVTLRLDSGEEVEGTVAKVGNTVVHISNLPENELFFMLVNIDRISTIKLMVRQR